jgi:hypothetical protein
MSNYQYPQPTSVTFGSRDLAAAGTDAKIVSGVPFDLEFDALVVAVNSKLNIDNPTFTGVMNGDSATVSSINGGTF